MIHKWDKNICHYFVIESLSVSNFFAPGYSEFKGFVS